jgi:hypothetical protein
MKSLFSLSALVVTPMFLGAAEMPLGDADFAPSPAHPVGYRGDGSGRFIGATPVTEFDYATGKNIVWKTPVDMSDGGAILVGDKVFTCADPGKLVCLDAKTGKLLWEKSADPLDLTMKDKPEEAKKIREDFYAQMKAHDEAKANQKDVKPFKASLEQIAKKWDLPSRAGVTMSSGTPVSDGKRVYTRFWNGVLTAWNLDGTVAWMQLANSAGIFTGLNSPVLVDGKVIVTLGKSYALGAYSVDDGKQVWTTLDPNEKKPKGFRRNGHGGSGTLVVVAHGAKKFLVLVGGEILDAETGKQVGDTEGYCAQIGESPGVFQNQVFFQKGDYHAPNKDPRIVSFSIKTDGSFDKVFDLRNLNDRAEKGSTNTSPVYYEGFWYLPCLADGKIQIIDAAKASNEMTIPCDLRFPGAQKTGNLLLPNPAIAGKLLVMCNDQGSIAFFDPATKKTVSKNLVPPYSGNLFFQGDRIYLRAMKEVICIGKN